MSENNHTEIQVNNLQTGEEILLHTGQRSSWFDVVTLVGAVLIPLSVIMALGFHMGFVFGPMVFSPFIPRILRGVKSAYSLIVTLDFNANCLRSEWSVADTTEVVNWTVKFEEIKAVRSAKTRSGKPVLYVETINNERSYLGKTSSKEEASNILNRIAELVKCQVQSSDEIVVVRPKTHLAPNTMKTVWLGSILWAVFMLFLTA